MEASATWASELGERVEARLDLVFIGAGGTYPLWRLLAPEAARDPWWPWIALGLAFALVGGLIRARGEAGPRSLVFLPTLLATIHLHILFAFNPSQPFYALAGVMIVFASALLMRSTVLLLAYTALNLVLAALPLWLLGAQRSSLFYFAGVASVMFWANRSWLVNRAERRLASSSLNAVKSELEQERAQRQRLERELQTAQRMDSLGRLAGAFSHEFNNQLMAIRIHTDLLERSLPAGAPQRADLERIHETTSSAADLTARLLTFSRPSRVREEPANVAAVVKASGVTLRHLMTEKTPVAITTPDAACVAPVGARELSQVLLNMALNARDAMPEGGTLRVEVARIPRRSVELPIDIPGKQLVVLTIQDSGAGMSADVRDRLFEPFFTTKSERGNSGLGLSVVYGIVKESGGHIRVTSEPGDGARFDIYWPEVVAGAAVRVDTGFAAPETPPQRARVLLVEDQPVLREGLSRWLGDHGYCVVSCESGEEALARASDVDVIAADVVLRGMDGIELLQRLRRAAPRLPAVLFSGHLDHLAKQRREIPDGVRFLEKPFAPEALVTTLDALVESARA